MSANKMYYMKRQKTKDYMAFQNEIRDELMGISWPFEEGQQLSFSAVVQFSNKAADLDNAIKPLLDTIQVIYEKQFNDKQIYHIDLEKRLGKRGAESIAIRIEPYVEQEVEESKQET